MISRLLPRRFRAGVAVPVVVVALLLWPAAAFAHAELETATPADGAVLEAPPTEIVFTYTEELDPTGSSLTLHDASGSQIAAGGVDPSDALIMRIDPPELAAGAYEVRSTALSAHDDHLERNVVSFTVSEPTPAPTPSQTPIPSATAEPTAPPSASPSAAPSPSPSEDGTPASTTDVLIPIVAAIVLVALLGAWLLSRSRGRRPA
ncbi:MAG TPA: copper resistance CopC family protein [Candidatus Limnocylindrales bacterium]|nr:copper resistance CopC family protein [Candidatus Limnocylindrales bacterium]